MLHIDVIKRFNAFKLNVKLSMENLEILVVLGPSGCGKTTLLNLVAGVKQPDKGVISYNHEVFYNSRDAVNMPIYKRNIGYIQQKSNLFPHMNVIENIKYAYKGFDIDMNEIIGALDISDILHKGPSEISGGQQQRVAIARAMAVNPNLLIMDEPFSSLDNMIKPKLRDMLIKINKEFKVPIIFVTHDIDEAYILGDKIAIMDKGAMLQVDSKERVYNHPKTSKVASFLGMRNIIKGNFERVDGKERLRIGSTLIKLPERVIQNNSYKSEQLTLAIRPEGICLADSDNKEQGEVLRAKVIEIHRGINNSRLQLNINTELSLEMCMDNYLLKKHDIKILDCIPIELRANAMAILNN